VIETITIPELDRLAESYRPNVWTDEEVAILKAYWMRVPVAALERHLHHGVKAIDDKAAELGLPARR
jgi:hypothetical protein